MFNSISSQVTHCLILLIHILCKIRCYYLNSNNIDIKLIDLFIDDYKRECVTVIKC